jgi:hypothetical protein
MKKILIILTLMVLVFAGCGRKADVPMDQLSDDGKYHYVNEQLGYSIDFPEEFIYYQTQRNNLGNYIDMDYFVPTSDREYPQTVQSYGRVVMVRVIDKVDYTDELSDETDIIGFVKIGESEDRLYFIDFWNTPPSDWTDKWNEEIRGGIEESFVIL